MNEFERIDSNKLKTAWIIIIPLYFFILKKIIILPVLSKLMTGQEDKIVYLFGHMIFQTTMFLGLLIFFSQTLSTSFYAIKNERWKNLLKKCLYGLGCIFFTCFISAVIEYFLGNGKIVLSQNEISLREIQEVAPQAIFISSVILGPVIEEIIFRLIIFRTFRKINLWCGMFISSIAFAFIHIENALLAGNLESILTSIPYFVMGMTFAYIYEKNRNLMVCIIVHSLYNLIV